MTTNEQSNHPDIPKTEIVNLQSDLSDYYQKGYQDGLRASTKQPVPSGKQDERESETKQQCPKCGSQYERYKLTCRICGELYQDGGICVRSWLPKSHKFEACSFPWHTQGQPEQSVEQRAREWLFHSAAVKRILASEDNGYVEFTRLDVVQMLAAFHTYMQGKE